MVRILSALIVAALVAVAPSVPVRAQSPEVQKVLADIKVRDKEQMAVSEEDGRFLRVLVAASKAKRALEIGGASGYSAIWIGMGLRDTGGQLVSIEYDPLRAGELAANVKRAGLSDVVTVVSGDAFQKLPSISGSFDVIFLDAWKKDYRKFFDMMLPRLNTGGMFVAHNVVNKRGEMGDFLDAIWKNPAVWTTIVAPSSEGMSISVKRQ